MPDQPLPTLAELVQWLRKEAAKSRNAVILAATPGFSGTPQEWAKDAAWHEAAARQIEALAGQVERLREARRVIATAELYDPATGIIDADVLEICQNEARAALAAPPAEEPR